MHMSSSCQKETQAYRGCLKENRIHKNGAKKCANLAKTLESCREKFRKVNKLGESQFDGTRVLPNPKCLPLNKKVQHCLKWKKGNEELCLEDIQNLKECMKTQKGVVADPTEGDKLWSDYKNRQQRQQPNQKERK